MDREQAEAIVDEAPALDQGRGRLREGDRLKTSRCDPRSWRMRTLCGCPLSLGIYLIIIVHFLAVTLLSALIVVQLFTQIGVFPVPDFWTVLFFGYCLAGIPITLGGLYFACARRTPGLWLYWFYLIGAACYETYNLIEGLFVRKSCIGFQEFLSSQGQEIACEGNVPVFPIVVVVLGILLELILIFMVWSFILYAGERERTVEKPMLTTLKGAFPAQDVSEFCPGPIAQCCHVLGCEVCPGHIAQCCHALGCCLPSGVYPGRCAQCCSALGCSVVFGCCGPWENPWDTTQGKGYFDIPRAMRLGKPSAYPVANYLSTNSNGFNGGKPIFGGSFHDTSYPPPKQVIF